MRRARHGRTARYSVARSGHCIEPGPVSYAIPRRKTCVGKVSCANPLTRVEVGGGDDVPGKVWKRSPKAEVVLVQLGTGKICRDSTHIPHRVDVEPVNVGNKLVTWHEYSLDALALENRHLRQSSRTGTGRRKCHRRTRRRSWFHLVQMLGGQACP